MSKVLVIDDDDLVRDTFVQMLTRAGFEVATAKNGREGLARFRSESPDVIMTDVIMPDQDGIETIMALRQASSTIPIIAISGGGRAHVMQFLDAAQKLGADMVLSKPIKQPELISAISRVLEIGAGRKSRSS